MSQYLLLHSSTVFYLLVSVLCFILCMPYFFSFSCQKLLAKYPAYPVVLLAIVLVFILGTRKYMADDYMYAWEYNHKLRSSFEIDWHIEWAWKIIAHICLLFKLSARNWMNVVCLLYFFNTLLACKVFLKENPIMSMFFYLTSFSFLSYAVNTIRSGFACSLLLVALSLAIEKKQRLLPLAIMVFAIGCHKSCLLPVSAFLGALFLFKGKMGVIRVWFISLVVSIIMGPTVVAYLGGLGFDGRVSDYASQVTSDYRTGFRIDFLVYGAIPLLLYWYIVIKKKIRDVKFELLCKTYILANAVWIQFIRIPYTDRFAYLAWFMLPMILAYAAIRVPVWQDQDRKASYFLLGQTAFTMIMNFSF